LICFFAALNLAAAVGDIRNGEGDGEFARHAHGQLWGHLAGRWVKPILSEAVVVKNAVNGYISKQAGDVIT